MRADRIIWLMSAGLVCAGLAMLPIAPPLIWNRTESMPVGLYVLSPAPSLQRGMVVAYKPSASEAAFLETHGYTGRGWALVKRVAAIEGDEACRSSGDVYINGRLAAEARTFDRAGVKLPAWQGCQRLGPGDVLLLADHPHSVDGRYFGIQDTARIVGELRPVSIFGRREIPLEPGGENGR
jgi:conjugative transfer signal peptidase TraF